MDRIIRIADDMLFLTSVSFEYIFLLSIIFTVWYLPMRVLGYVSRLKNYQWHPLIFIVTTVISMLLGLDKIITTYGNLFFSYLYPINAAVKYLSIIWLIVTLKILVLVVAQAIRFSLVDFKAKHIQIDDKKFSYLSRRIVGDRPVYLLQVDFITGIASWGLVNACVFVPKGFYDLFDENERELLFTHELIHIKNYDSLKSTAIALIKSVFWFCPIVLHAMDRLRLRFEISCDNSVMKNFNAKQEQYSFILLKSISKPYELLSGISSDYADIKCRIQTIQQKSKHKSEYRQIVSLLIVAICIFSAFLLPYKNMPTFPENYKSDVNITFMWQGIFGLYSVCEIRR